jgi:hypothetical protein
MKVVFIHGNNATDHSFNYLVNEWDQLWETDRFLPDHMFLNYDSENGFYNNLETMKTQLENEDEIFFVTHSLGGIYALHLADHFKDTVFGCVSVSAPFGGSEAASYLGMLFPDQVYKDIGPYADPIHKASKFDVTIPWTAVVSTAGRSSMMRQLNDGVLTNESMRARKDVEYVDINLNHFEVLLSYDLVTLVSNTVSHVAMVN